MEKILIFTDGSCTNNGKKYAKAGYGIHFPNNEYDDVSKPFLIEPITNQRAELYAIQEALNTISDENGKIGKRVELYTDSQYSLKCLTQWIRSWEKKKWKSSKGEKVKNLDIIKPTYQIIKNNPFKIFFHHVKSHTGKKDFDSVHNDIADKLAGAGLNGKEVKLTNSKTSSGSIKNISNLDELEKSIDLTNKMVKEQTFNNFSKYLESQQIKNNDDCANALEQSIKKTNENVKLKKMSTVSSKDINFENFYKMEQEYKNYDKKQFCFQDFDQLSKKKTKKLVLNFDTYCKSKGMGESSKKKKTLEDFFSTK